MKVSYSEFRESVSYVEAVCVHVVAYISVFYMILHFQWPQVTGFRLSDSRITS
jgi:hypothetical protein